MLELYLCFVLIFIVFSVYLFPFDLVSLSFLIVILLTCIWLTQFLCLLRFLIPQFSLSLCLFYVKSCVPSPFYICLWMNEWMNDAFFIALYCVLLYTQSALQSCGGGGLSSTTTSVQHPLGWSFFFYLNSSHKKHYSVIYALKLFQVSSVKHKRHFEKCRCNVTKQLMVAIDFHNIFSILWKSMATVYYLVTSFLQNICFCA